MPFPSNVVREILSFHSTSRRKARVVLARPSIFQYFAREEWNSAFKRKRVLPWSKLVGASLRLPSSGGRNSVFLHIWRFQGECKHSKTPLLHGLLCSEEPIRSQKYPRCSSWTDYFPCLFTFRSWEVFPHVFSLVAAQCLPRSFLDLILFEQVRACNILSFLHCECFLSCTMKMRSQKLAFVFEILKGFLLRVSATDLWCSLFLLERGGCTLLHGHLET